MFSSNLPNTSMLRRLFLEYEKFKIRKTLLDLALTSKYPSAITRNILTLLEMSSFVIISLTLSSNCPDHRNFPLQLQFYISNVLSSFTD